MENITLKVTAFALEFIDNSDNSLTYSIELDRLCETIDSSGSEWIHQLLEKSWASPALLYKVAKQIQKRGPANSFDWEEIFFPVEKKDYLEKYTKFKNDLENNTNTNPYDDIRKRVSNGIEENNEDVNGAI